MDFVVPRLALRQSSPPGLHPKLVHPGASDESGSSGLSWSSLRREVLDRSADGSSGASCGQRSASTRKQSVTTTATYRKVLIILFLLCKHFITSQLGLTHFWKILYLHSEKKSLIGPFHKFVSYARISGKLSGIPGYSQRFYYRCRKHFLISSML